MCTATQNMFHLHVCQLSECKHRKAILFVSGSPLLSLFYLSLVISPLYTRTLPSAKPTAICVRFSISARHDTCQSHQQKHWQKVPLILTSQRQNLLFLSFSIQTTEWLEMPTVENYKKNDHYQWCFLLKVDPYSVPQWKIFVHVKTAITQAGQMAY